MLERAFKKLEESLLPVTDNWIVALVLVLVAVVARYVLQKTGNEINQEPNLESNVDQSMELVPGTANRASGKTKSNGPEEDC